MSIRFLGYQAASCYSVYRGKSIIYTCIYVSIIVQYCNNFLLTDFDDYIPNFFIDYRLWQIIPLAALLLALILYIL